MVMSPEINGKKNAVDFDLAVLFEAAFEEIMSYWYEDGKYRILNHEIAMAMLKISDYLGLKDLNQKLLQYFTETLNESSALGYLGLCMKFMFPALASKCIPLIRDDISATSDKEMHQLPYEMFLILLRNEQLDLGEEEQYFHSIQSYVKKHFDRLEDGQKYELWSECRFSVLNEDCMREVLQDPTIPSDLIPKISARASNDELFEAFKGMKTHEPRQNSRIRWSRTTFKQPDMHGFVSLSEDKLSITHISAAVGGTYQTVIGTNGLQLVRKGLFFWGLEFLSLPSEKFDFGMGFCEEGFPANIFLGDSKDKVAYAFFFNNEGKVWKHETNKLPSLVGNLRLDLDSKIGMLLESKRGRGNIALFLNEKRTSFGFQNIETTKTLFPAISTVDTKTALRVTFHEKIPYEIQ